jgi:hypothetical protein
MSKERNDGVAANKHIKFVRNRSLGRSASLQVPYVRRFYRQAFSERFFFDAHDKRE